MKRNLNPCLVAMAAMSSARRAGPALRYPPSAHRFPATVSPARLPITLTRTSARRSVFLYEFDLSGYPAITSIKEGEILEDRAAFRRQGSFQRAGQLPDDKAASRELDSFKQDSLLGQGRFQRIGQLPEDRATSRGQGRFQRTGQPPEGRVASRGQGSF